MNLLQRGQAMLNRHLTNAGGVSIVYLRGAVAETISAWLGREQSVTTTGEDALQVKRDIGDRNYLIVFADLVKFGLGEPQKGDRIIETINGEDVTFELLPLNGVKSWDWSDTSRTRVRVRAKRVS